MIIKSADFAISNTNPAKCPEYGKPEFAFIGRSNVGKSSLINLLVSRKNLALTSSTPGKTKTINHFFINQQWYLVDLPGYGYASVSKEVHQSWSPMIENYLLHRKDLVTAFILLDARLNPQKIDIEFVRWMGTKGIPFSLVYTKTDKISKQALKVTHGKWEEVLSPEWSELPLFFTTSSKNKTGRDEILAYIQSLLKSL